MPHSGSGEIQKKILLLFMAGIALGLSGSPRRSFRIIRMAKREWKWINDQKLKRSISALYKSKLIKKKINNDGTLTLVLTEKGKELALTYDIDDMKIKRPIRWDKKWRIIIFDIPEKIKKKREALRLRLKNIGFFELQKSVFICPFECKKETEYIVEFYQIRKFVRYIEAIHVDNEPHLKHYFEM